MADVGGRAVGAQARAWDDGEATRESQDHRSQVPLRCALPYARLWMLRFLQLAAVCMLT